LTVLLSPEVRLWTDESRDPVYDFVGFQNVNDGELASFVEGLVGWLGEREHIFENWRFEGKDQILDVKVMF